MRKTVKRAVICLALGLLYNTSIGLAADELLAKTELNRAGEKINVELWGSPIKGGYKNDLTVIFKRNDNSVVTAHKPTVAGGYNCLLKSVNVIGKDADEQLLLSVGQGTWNVPSDYRIIDYDKKGKVTEIFGGKESLGIVLDTKVENDSISVVLKNGETNSIKIVKNLDDTEKKRISFDGIFSLTPHDIDGDGVVELFLDQEIKARNILLADVGYMLKYDKKEKTWSESMVTLMGNSVSEKKNSVNDGRAFNNRMIMPRKIVVPFGEATYPEFAGADVEVNNKVNKLLNDELDLYFSKVFEGSIDLAFNIIRTDSNLWSIQLISGKKEFNHHNINIDPVSHKIVKLESILDIKNKKLVSALKKLSEESNPKFNGVISNEWYIFGNDLHLLQKNTEGKDETVIFPLEKLQEFIIDKKWILEKNKEDTKTEEKKEKTQEEKFWDRLLGAGKEEEKTEEVSPTQEKDGSEKHDNLPEEADEIKKTNTDTEKKEKLTDESVNSEFESKKKKTEEKTS